MRNIVIIGNGISGITCARNIRKLSDDNITVISAETKHFYSRTALMYVYMGHMKYENIKPYEDWFWEKNRINLVQNFVQKIDSNNKQLFFSDGTTINYDVLVLATGSQTSKFGWPGQDLIGVQGLYNLQDLKSMEANTKNIHHAVIVGGGLIGVEMAEMLHSRGIHLTFLVREKYFWNNVLPMEDAMLVGNHIAKHGIEFLYETELKEIRADENGRVKEIETTQGKIIKCQFVGLTTGVKPNISFVQGSGINTDKGIMINEYFETNVSNIYAIGDCAQFEKPLPGRKPIEQVWYTGRMHGETLARTICGSKTFYKPSVWFNSAKFFNLEYQTYGVVMPTPQENETSFFWQHPQKDIAIRFVYDKNTQRCIAVNSYGIRLRHEYFDKWLKEEKSISYVLQNLSKANFDPEFFKHYEHLIIAAFTKQTNIAVVAPRKKMFALFNL